MSDETKRIADEMVREAAEWAKAHPNENPETFKTFSEFIESLAAKGVAVPERVLQRAREKRDVSGGETR